MTYNVMIKTNTMPNGWEVGIIVFIFLNGDRDIINNYRQKTILNTIYKIWTIILPSRITPFVNMLTSELQIVYKKR